MAITTTDGYTGFDSKNYERNKSYSVFNVECVKKDLLNHIFTRKGERVRMRTFGTRIPDLTYQPLDQYTLAIIDEDLRAVFRFDPRVTLMDMRILPLFEQSAVEVIATLNFIYLNWTDEMQIHIDFENN